jgi:hypothetical protein
MFSRVESMKTGSWFMFRGMVSMGGGLEGGHGFFGDGYMMIVAAGLSSGGLSVAAEEPLVAGEEFVERLG